MNTLVRWDRTVPVGTLDSAHMADWIVGKNIDGRKVSATIGPLFHSTDNNLAFSLASVALDNLRISDTSAMYAKL